MPSSSDDGFSSPDRADNYQTTGLSMAEKWALNEPDDDGISIISPDHEQPDPMPQPELKIPTSPIAMSRSSNDSIDGATPAKRVGSMPTFSTGQSGPGQKEIPRSAKEAQRSQSTSTYTRKPGDNTITRGSSAENIVWAFWYVNNTKNQDIFALMERPDGTLIRNNLYAQSQRAKYRKQYGRSPREITYMGYTIKRNGVVPEEVAHDYVAWLIANGGTAPTVPIGGLLPVPEPQSGKAYGDGYKKIKPYIPGPGPGISYTRKSYQTIIENSQEDSALARSDPALSQLPPLSEDEEEEELEEVEQDQVPQYKENEGGGEEEERDSCMDESPVYDMGSPPALFASVEVEEGLTRPVACAKPPSSLYGLSAASMAPEPGDRHLHSDPSRGQVSSSSQRRAHSKSAAVISSPTNNIAAGSIDIDMNLGPMKDSRARAHSSIREEGANPKAKNSMDTTESLKALKSIDITILRSRLAQMNGAGPENPIRQCIEIAIGAIQKFGPHGYYHPLAREAMLQLRQCAHETLDLPLDDEHIIYFN